MPVSCATRARDFQCVAKVEWQWVEVAKWRWVSAASSRSRAAGRARCFACECTAHRGSALAKSRPHCMHPNAHDPLPCRPFAMAAFRACMHLVRCMQWQSRVSAQRAAAMAVASSVVTGRQCRHAARIYALTMAKRRRLSRLVPSHEEPPGSSLQPKGPILAFPRCSGWLGHPLGQDAQWVAESPAGIPLHVFYQVRQWRTHLPCHHSPFAVPFVGMLSG